jgi:iron complex outermembrane recepter protein
MKSFQPGLRPYLAAVLPIALAASAFAQTSAPAAANKDEVVTLSEFSVKAEGDRGYVASEAITGSRVATKIIDLPYTVNVLTSEFFEDFAMFELGDNITQIGSFQSLDIGGGFTLRGFSATSQLRDGFYRLGRYGSSNIDRLEIIKGSNAAIYGRTSPGGMVNFISKAPKTRESEKITLNYGDYNTQRWVLETTGPVLQSTLGKTYYILTASQYQRGFKQDFARNHNQEYYLAVKHVFGDNSSLTLSAEYFLQIRHAPPSSAQIITDAKGTSSTTDDEVIGYTKALSKINAAGPYSELNRGNISYIGTYEKRFNDVWSYRASAQYFRARRWDFNQNNGWGSVTVNNVTSAGAPVAPTSSRGATPNKGLIMEDGGGVQSDVLAHYWVANHSIENRTLATIDFNDYYRWDPTWNYGPSNDPALTAWSAVRTVTLDPTTLAPTAPVQYFTRGFNWGGESLSRLTRRRTTVLGGLIRQQAGFFNGRLLAFAGVRFDDVRFQERDFRQSIDETGKTYAPGAVLPTNLLVYLPGQMIRRTLTQTKPNVGVNYKVAGNFRVFANYSQSYFVNQTDNPETFVPTSYKPETAAGYDYGFKGDMLDGRLTFTASGFYATRQNVSVSDTFEFPLGSGTFVTQNRRDGDQLVRGYELDFNWRATDELSLLGSWGHVYSIYTDFGSASPLAIGRRVNGVVPENGSISARYAPNSGPLKNFSANLQWTYISSTPSEGPTAGDTYVTNPDGSRTVTRTTYQWRLRIPSYGIWNGGIRYTLRRNAHWDHTLAINVNNIADLDYLKISKQPGDRRSFYFTYTLTHH